MKDLTKIKKPFGLLGEKTQTALQAHGGPYLCQSVSGKWSDVCNPTWFPEIAYRVKPQPKPTIETATEYSKKSKIYAAVRKFQVAQEAGIFSGIVDTQLRLLELRVPS
jgi:hypothetical protein